MLFDQNVIRVGMFFSHDLGKREILFQSGALDLSGLLGDRTLSDQDKMMPSGQVMQGLRDLWQEFDWMVRHSVRKTGDLGVQLRRNGLHAKPLKRVHQCVRKAVQAVAMLHDAFALHIVEHLAYLLRRKLVVIEKRNEAGDRPLKVNI